MRSPARVANGLAPRFPGTIGRSACARTTVVLSGSICALATPLCARDDALDLGAYARLIEHQLAGGTRALVAAGSTGEAAALDEAEYSALVECAAVRVSGRVPLLAGSGLSGTRRTIAQTRRAAAAGAWPRRRRQSVAGASRRLPHLPAGARDSTCRRWCSTTRDDSRCTATRTRVGPCRRGPLPFLTTPTCVAPHPRAGRSGRCSSSCRRRRLHARRLRG